MYKLFGTEYGRVGIAIFLISGIRIFSKILRILIKVKVKQSCYKLGVAQRVPGN